MSNFFKHVTETVKKRPAIALKYDVSASLYESKKDAQPMQKNTASGDIKVDIVAFLGALLALQTVFSVLKCVCRRKKNKKKNK